MPTSLYVLGLSHDLPSPPPHFKLQHHAATISCSGKRKTETTCLACGTFSGWFIRSWIACARSRAALRTDRGCPCVTARTALRLQGGHMRLWLQRARAKARGTCKGQSLGVCTTQRADKLCLQAKVPKLQPDGEAMGFKYCTCCQLMLT